MCAGICKLRILYTVYVRSHFPGACGKARWFLDICREAFACIFQHLDDDLAAAGAENLQEPGIRFEKDFRLLERGE